MKKFTLALIITATSFASCRKETFEIRTPEQMQMESSQNELDQFVSAEDTAAKSLSRRAAVKFFTKKVRVFGNTTLTTTVTRNSLNQMTKEVIEDNTKYWGLKTMMGYPIPNHSLVTTSTKEYIISGSTISVFESVSSRRVPVNSKDAAALAGSIPGVPDPINVARRQTATITLNSNNLISSITYTPDKFTKVGVAAGTESDLPLVSEVHTQSKMSDGKMKTTRIVKTFRNTKSTQTLTYDFTWKNTFTFYTRGTQTYKSPEWMIETVRTNGTQTAKFDSRQEYYFGDKYSMPKGGDFWNEGTYQGIIPSVETISGIGITFSTLGDNNIYTLGVGSPDRLSFLRLRDSNGSPFIEGGSTTFTY